MFLAATLVGLIGGDLVDRKVAERCTLRPQPEMPNYEENK